MQAQRGSLGGLLNVVTYSGSNEFHGSVFGFYTSNKLTENQKNRVRWILLRAIFQITMLVSV